MKKLVQWKIEEEIFEKKKKSKWYEIANFWSNEWKRLKMIEYFWTKLNYYNIQSKSNFKINITTCDR